jgi:hypothetical protein
MKKVGVMVLTILSIFMLFSFVIAELDLPAPPPVPGIDGGSNTSVPNTYVPLQPTTSGNSVTSDSGVSSESGQSSGSYWAYFVGVLILIVAIAIILIRYIRKMNSLSPLAVSSTASTVSSSKSSVVLSKPKVSKSINKN